MLVTLVLKNVLMDMVISSFTVRHMFDCVTECFWSTSCVSFLFEESSKTCHFCDGVYAGNLSWFTAQQGLDYYVYDTRLEETYDSILGYRYKIHPEKKKWVEARKVCQDEGGELAIPETEMQREFYMSTLFSGLLDDDVFIGGERSAGGWKWVDGTDIGNDVHITETNPSVQDCLEFDPTRQIYAERCNDNSVEQPFICEYR